MQGAKLPAEAVSGLPGGAGDPAGVGERGASSANHQPGYQLLLRPVSTLDSLTWDDAILGPQLPNYWVSVFFFNVISRESSNYAVHLWITPLCLLA